MFPFTPKRELGGRGGAEGRGRKEILSVNMEEKGKKNETGLVEVSQKDANTQGGIFKGTPQDPIIHERTGISETSPFHWPEIR